jgi:hypothetical protein
MAGSRGLQGSEGQQGAKGEQGSERQQASKGKQDQGGEGNHRKFSRTHCLSKLLHNYPVEKIEKICGLVL